jgi:hypothetical protein
MSPQITHSKSSSFLGEHVVHSTPIWTSPQKSQPQVEIQYKNQSHYHGYQYHNNMITLSLRRGTQVAKQYVGRGRGLQVTVITWHPKFLIIMEVWAERQSLLDRIILLQKDHPLCKAIVGYTTQEMGLLFR